MYVVALNYILNKILGEMLQNTEDACLGNNVLTAELNHYNFFITAQRANGQNVL